MLSFTVTAIKIISGVKNQKNDFFFFAVQHRNFASSYIIYCFPAH